MALALYYNTEYMQQPRILGVFNYQKSKAIFEYALRDETDKAIHSPDFPHIIFVNSVSDCGYRAAKVLKNVVYVVVDENDDGYVIEKWPIKSHRYYS